jgi:hypothetical protein
MISKINKKIIPYIAATLIGLSGGAHSEGLQENQNVDERKVSIENILNQYGEIEKWKDSQNGRFYIISSDRKHTDVAINRNSAKAFSDLVEKGVISDLGLEGRFDGEVLSFNKDSSIRNDFPYASNGEWNDVSPENYMAHGISMVALEHPGVEIVGIDDRSKAVETVELVKTIKKEPNNRVAIMQDIRKLGYERSVRMADYMENHEAFGDTIGVMVGRKHVDQILENISPESGYVIFNANGGDVVDGSYLNRLIKAEKNSR